jgi:hypothetical protein
MKAYGVKRKDVEWCRRSNRSRQRRARREEKKIVVEAPI